MRIKLSKQNWRLVGQKMGWLKRAQITTDAADAGGAKSTGAAEAMGIGPGKITPGSLNGNTGNVDEGKMKYNEVIFDSKDKNIRLDQGLITEVQFDLLKDIDHKISVLYRYISLKDWKHPATNSWFGSIRDQYGNRSGPITSESVEDALKNWGDIESYIARGRNRGSGIIVHNQDTKTKRELKNNYTPAQLQHFEKAVAERLQKVESLKGLVLNAFRTSMAGKPQMGNTEGLNLDTGDVKL